MKCVNFDEKFEQYTINWMHQNAARYKNNLDAMEARMPEVYDEWLAMPQTWLGGVTPGEFFKQYDGAELLVEWMLDYFRERVPVPDQLLERITSLGESAEIALDAVLANGFQTEEARMTAVSLLSEMGSHRPMQRYIHWIKERNEKDDLADLAAEALTSMGDCVVEPILLETNGATPAGQETFADVLCNFPGNPLIFELTHSLFESRKQKRTLFASLLSKLNDSRALPTLQAAIRAEDIQYLDFIELRNAIESLGGDAPEPPDFAGDPFYTSLRGVES